MLVANGLLALGAHEGERMTGITGPSVRLKPKAAETIAPVIHERATNAMKYCTLSIDYGRIMVEWSIERPDGEPHLVLCWFETDVRLSGERPQQHGFDPVRFQAEGQVLAPSGSEPNVISDSQYRTVPLPKSPLRQNAYLTPQ